MEKSVKKKKKVRSRSRAWWSRHVKRCVDSDMTIAEYARQNDLNPGTLYAWRGKILSSKKAPTAKDLPAEPAEESGLNFMELSSFSSGSFSSEVEFKSPSGWSFTISSDLGKREILRFIEILKKKS